MFAMTLDEILAKVRAHESELRDLRVRAGVRQIRVRPVGGFEPLPYFRLALRIG